MSQLELKVPPVLLMLIVGVLMWLVSLWLPGISLPASIRPGTLSVLTIVGGLIAVSGVISFRKAKTTVNPTRPDATCSLVTSGVYKYTRNPMYVGFALVLVGWGVFLANLFSMAMIVCFVLYMNRFQIQPEEKALESIFGNEYLTYKSRVRRWMGRRNKT